MKKVVFTLFILMFFSCKKERLKDDKEVLIGTWNWIYSDHDFGWCQNMQFSEALTPQSENTEFSIFFEKKGIVSLYKGDNLINEHRIVFNYFKQEPMGDYSFSIMLDNNEETRLGGIGNENEMRFFHFPFDEISGCESYKNYFIKQ